MNHDLPQVLPSAQNGAVWLVPSCRPLRQVVLCSTRTLGALVLRQQIPEPSTRRATTRAHHHHLAITVASGCNSDIAAQRPNSKPLGAVVYHSHLAILQNICKPVLFIPDETVNRPV